MEEVYAHVKASEFKDKCLELMEEVTKSGEQLVITKHGKPVSLLSPYTGPSTTLFGRHRDSLTICGDILAPIEDTWEA